MPIINIFGFPHPNYDYLSSVVQPDTIPTIDIVLMSDWEGNRVGNEHWIANLVGMAILFYISYTEMHR